jgi:hypothetical protein
VGDAPTGEQVATHPPEHDGVEQPGRADHPQYPDRGTSPGRDLPEIRGQEVGEDVVGDDAGHPRLAGGGADRETATERDAHQRHPVQAEVVQDGADRAMPVRGEPQAVVFEGAALPRPLDADHLISVARDHQHHRQELLEVAVEAAEEDHRPLGRRPTRYPGSVPPG